MSAMTTGLHTLRVFALDIELNAQGIAAWLDRKSA